VFVPVFSSHERVDLAYIHPGRTEIVRLQCKTARRQSDALLFRTSSNTANCPRGYLGEIGEFGVFSPDTGLVYLVPVVGLPSRYCTLRLSPAHNHQLAGVRWARDYELGPP
jgi:hypothetical protein